eukprot:TRINITY_DN3281_c0_g1_i1.p1 TRINITY_DN3281_c0_g1~~TRINITY_DN3281_c0_g1_i1.p1  ORF type:complete len:223 (-),score=35.71 TRINITY_DN3281_c0_g1_i1:245-913(-)
MNLAEKPKVFGGLMVFMSCVGLFLFVFSATQVSNQIQDGNTDVCTDLNKGGYLAINRPWRWIENKYKDDDPDKYSMCGWKNMNSSLRMSFSFLTVISGVAICISVWYKRDWPIRIAGFVVFLAGSILLGSMCYDANDVTASKDWCDNAGEHDVPNEVTCQYENFQYLVFAESLCAIVFDFMAFVIYMYLRQRKDIRNTPAVPHAQTGAAPGNAPPARPASSI